MVKKSICRNRIIYAFLILIVILLGLGSRKFSSVLPQWIGSYLGDTLWALMVFLMVGFIFNKFKTSKVAVGALIFSYLIEISQLYHAPWIDAIRHTRLGGLVLGFGFLWSDLICYTIGILIGVFFEMVFISFYKINK